MRSALVILPLLLIAQGPGQRAEVDAARITRFHRIVTQEPRLAGTPADMRAAARIKSAFLAAGLAVEEEEYDVWLSRGGASSLELLGKKPIKLPLTETGFEWDRDSFHGTSPRPFLAYSPSGKVTADVVYVNYGLPADYEALEELGVEVSGRIVIARYGKSFRGVKLKAAEEHGAAAVLIYTDPADSGYTKGDVYPRGRMAPETAVQRGSALYIFEYPGDPLTPKQPAVPGVKPLRRAAARSLPKIPAMPIPYAAAKPILEKLGGPEVPGGWQGGLPFRYHTGPGPAKVAFKTENSEQHYKIKNVFGVLEGKSGPKGDFVMLGNHRDSWCSGAIDPASGTACMLEVATVLGARKKAGWTPDYTIRFASWGGEEYGVIGSTEYGENHAAMLRQHLVAYVNADAVVSGSKFTASATPSLRGFARRVAPLPEGKDADVGELGGGSDFMVFLDRIGTPCVEFGMSGQTGVYHSAFDTHWFMANRVDRGFAYHARVAKVLVEALAALAHTATDAYDPAEAYEDCAATLEKMRAKLPAKLLDACLDLAKQNAAAARTLRKTGSFARRELARADQLWLDERGLWGRDWFLNLLLAPGLRTGYAAVRLPGVTEAVESGDAERVRAELTRLHDLLAKAKAAVTKLLDSRR